MTATPDTLSSKLPATDLPRPGRCGNNERQADGSVARSAGPAGRMRQCRLLERVLLNQCHFQSPGFTSRISMIKTRNYRFCWLKRATDLTDSQSDFIGVIRGSISAWNSCGRFL